jgi:hypothetical protein
LLDGVYISMPNDELYAVPGADDPVGDVIVEETVWKEIRVSRRWGVRNGDVRLKAETGATDSVHVIIPVTPIGVTDSIHVKGVPPIKTGRMLVTGSITLHDDEDFSADEVATRSDLSGWKEVDQDIPKIVKIEGRCGGEVRLEVEFQGVLNVHNPDFLELYVAALLFEGVSDSNRDLDGQFDADFRLKRGETVVVSGIIFNKEGDEGDLEDNDWASFRAVVSFE